MLSQIYELLRPILAELILAVIALILGWIGRNQWLTEKRKELIRKIIAIFIGVEEEPSRFTDPPVPSDVSGEKRMEITINYVQNNEKEIATMLEKRYGSVEIGLQNVYDENAIDIKLWRHTK